MSNNKLHAAKRAKNDEFYTQMTDIEREMVHYRRQFVGKTIFCNCDDPEESNFWKYFYTNFDYLMLEGLISTHYEYDKQSYKLEVYRDTDTGMRGRICRTPLKGNGDFRSDECVELLKQVDIVITNPPFSLFREYVAQLMEYDKKFIIIGNINAITYKEIFPLIRDNKLWAGANSKGGTRKGNTLCFAIPEGHEVKNAVLSPDGKPLTQVSAWWFTNMDLKKRHDELFLYRHYHGKDHDRYPKYDNYDAIEVSKTVDIPCDYDGVMGVPITFLDKFNPDQFEIIGMCENKDLYGLKTRVYSSEECKQRYMELFGKKGTYDLNASGVVNGKKVYQRILIRRKH